jgi:hypothetical protein
MGPYPSLVLKNQFGEESNNFVLGGTSQISCSFIVDETNGNGLGIRSLKSTSPNGVSAVYMHTTATPASGNPNPAVGYILVEFAEKFAGYVSGTYGFIAPGSGSNVNVTSGLTQYAVYEIVSVGTTTQNQWATLGLPAGVVPSVGLTFVAATSSAGTGTGVVQLIASSGSGIDRIEAVGDPNQSAQNGYMILALYAPTSSSVTTAVTTQPAQNTVIGLTFNMLPPPSRLI